MGLRRILEPEVMDTEEEARDYDAMDHAEVNARFCEDLLAVRARPERVLDVGTGTALIPIALCQRCPEANVDAIDLASHMLSRARDNVERAGLSGRIRLARVDAKATGWDDGWFYAVMSNSIVHHIPEPQLVLREMWRIVRRGGVLFVRDLVRPESQALLADLVAKYAGPAPLADPERRAAWERQRGLFEASLKAALTVDEVAAMVRPLGLPEDAVRATSDRHWTLCGEKP